MFQISDVLSNKLPVMFKLVDLMQDDIPGYFYNEELTKAPKPDYQKDYFFVEKVLKTKKVKGELFYLVKYAWYPNKFNQVSYKMNDPCYLIIRG